MVDNKKSNSGNKVDSEVLQETKSANESLGKDEKILSVLGYISFLCVLPLCLRPKSEFCKFHGKQGLVLAIAFFFLTLIGSLAGSFLSGIIGFIQLIIIGSAMISAGSGKKLAFPIVSDITKKLDL